MQRREEMDGEANVKDMDHADRDGRIISLQPLPVPCRCCM